MSKIRGGYVSDRWKRRRLKKQQQNKYGEHLG